MSWSRQLDDLERLLGLGLRADARRTGVPEATARILLALHPDEDVPMGEVALRIGREPSTATRFVDRAVREGLVERRLGLDRRRRLARLTPAGTTARVALCDIRDARTRALPRAVQERTGLGEEEVAWFVEALVHALRRP